MDALHGSPHRAPPDLVQVVLPVGVDRTFVYGVPPELGSAIRLGVQVRVPFRRRSLMGVVVALEGAPPPGRLRQLSGIPDPGVALSGEMLDFTRWLASYYGASWGDVARTALPAYLGRRSRRVAAADREAAAPAGAGDALPGAEPPVPSDEQRSAIDTIVAQLSARRFGVVVLHGVTASGKTEVYMRAAERALAEGGQTLVLVPEISISVQLLEAFRLRFGDRVCIFHSDLTEVERRRTWKAVSSGECGILVGARSALFAPFVHLRLVVVDEEHETAYKQSEQPRYHARDAAVMRARMNETTCVLGSATPSLETAANVERGRYAIVRMRQRIDERAMATVELIDLRTWRDERRAEIDARRRARRRTWQRERVARWAEEATAANRSQRPGGSRSSLSRPAASPAGERAAGDAAAVAVLGAETRPPESEPDFMSPPLMSALETTLERSEQTILLVGRRGHATFAQCMECGDVATCRSCAVSLVHHAVDQTLRCHHCGRREVVPGRCEVCAGERFWFGGVGTQRVEREIHRRLPEARVLRMDLDSTRRPGSHTRLLDAFGAGEADILLGTQMVAKGLHFPRVTLVGVVSADVQLNLPDFRAGERTFQLLTQVAGRAGRGGVPGRVIIQTYLPEHPAIQAAAAQDFEMFYEQEMADRRELGYPPVGCMARFLIDGPLEEDVVQVADRLARSAEGIVAGRTRVLGPAPLPLARLRGRHRWHLTLIGQDRGSLCRGARSIYDTIRAERLPGRLRLFMDMDPVHLL